VGIQMFKASGIIIVLLFALTCSAQLQIPVGPGSRSSDDSSKKTRVTSRTLTGTVLDKSDKPVPNAIVYLENKKTLAVKTYIAKDDGTFRFPELSPNVDYEIHAEKDGNKSSTKTLSQFDDRDKPMLNLRINTK
jgi:hypothetical protein